MNWSDSVVQAPRISNPRRRRSGAIWRPHSSSQAAISPGLIVYIRNWSGIFRLTALRGRVRVGARPPAFRGWFEGTPPRLLPRVTRPGGVVRPRRQPYSRRVGRSGAPWYATQPAPAREVRLPPGDPAPAEQSRPLDPERQRRTGGRALRTRRSSRRHRTMPPPCPLPQAGEGDVNALSQAEEVARTWLTAHGSGR